LYLFVLSKCREILNNEGENQLMDVYDQLPFEAA